MTKCKQPVSWSAAVQQGKVGTDVLQVKEGASASQGLSFQCEKKCREEKLECKHPAALHACEKDFTVMKERII